MEILVALLACVACSSSPPPGGDAGNNGDAGSNGDAGGDVASDAPSLTCDPGLTACNGACVDTQNDSANCGACGKTCSIACSAGACVTTCPSPKVLCGGVCVTPNATLSGDVQPIFTASCALAGCHSGAKPQENMLLSSGSTYSNIVNVTAAECNTGIKRVTPNNVDQSYLMDKLLGKNLCFGTQMPKTGASLSSSQLDSIRSWICAGAQNN